MPPLPAHLSPTLDRLQIHTDTWLSCVADFGRWFRSAAGTPASLADHAQRQRRHWLHGISKSRLAFG